MTQSFATFRRLLLQIARGSIIVPAILIFLTHGFLVQLFVRNPHRRREMLIRNVSRYSRFALRVLKVRITTTGLLPTNENFLILSNHMSYIDMMVISAVAPAVFVTSLDMGEIFFLGTMAEIGGSLFIERRHRERIAQDVEQIRDVLMSGRNVVLFPEGTSSDGQTVLPFKRGLIMGGPAAGKRILPLTLKYERIDHREFSSDNHQRVCWYGKMSFFPHFLNLLTYQSVEAKIQFHLPITPREGDTKERLALWTHRIIHHGYHTKTQETARFDETYLPLKANHFLTEGLNVHG